MSLRFRWCGRAWLWRLAALFTLAIFPLAWLIFWQEDGGGFWKSGWLLIKDIFKTMANGDWES